MAITLEQIGDLIKVKLRDSAAILAKSIEITTSEDVPAGLPHRVFYGVGGPKSPEVGEAPEFVILPLTKSAPQANDAVYEFMIGCALESSAGTSATTGTGVYCEKVSAFGYLEDLLDLAFAAVLTISGTLAWNRGDMEIDPTTLPPKYSATMTIAATVEYVMGGFSQAL